MDRTVTVAYLGPEGTYTHQAAFDLFGPTVEYLERTSITDVFHCVSASIQLGLIPQENSIFGSVTETYDLLRQQRAGSEVFVRGEITFRIQHCLVAREGVKLADVEEVLSHEQALGQCATFLKRSCPRAKLIKTTSTASAARLILHDPTGIPRAAICSRLCVTLYEGLNLLCEGIQDSEWNYTRFFILYHSLHQSLPTPVHGASPLSRALLKISSGPRTADNPSTVILQISHFIRIMTVDVVRIDRRPDPQSGPFIDVYFVEFQSSFMGKESSLSWPEFVHHESGRVAQAGASASIVGIW